MPVRPASDTHGLMRPRRLRRCRLRPDHPCRRRPQTRGECPAERNRPNPCRARKRRYAKLGRGRCQTAEWSRQAAAPLRSAHTRRANLRSCHRRLCGGDIRALAHAIDRDAQRRAVHQSQKRRSATLPAAGQRRAHMHIGAETRHRNCRAGGVRAGAPVGGASAQLTVTVVVHAPILAGMGVRTALATITPKKSVERQAATIENLMRFMGCSLGLTQHRMGGQQRGVPVVPGTWKCLWITQNWVLRPVLRASRRRIIADRHKFSTAAKPSALGMINS
jgi:hypothetical protein